MQQRNVLERTPVPAIEDSLGDEIERGCDSAPVALGEDQQRVLRQRCADAQEELQVQVRFRAVRGIGAPVAALEEFPVLAPDLRAAQPAERDARLAYAAPLLADRLAPPVGQLREE